MVKSFPFQVLCIFVFVILSYVYNKIIKYIYNMKQYTIMNYGKYCKKPGHLVNFFTHVGPDNFVWPSIAHKMKEWQYKVSY